MGERSRSLKVSIGTFSCAVDGFEDPFAAVREAAALATELVRGDPAFAAAAFGRMPEGPGTAPDAPSADPADRPVAHADIPQETNVDIMPKAGLPDPLTAAEGDALATAIARIAGRSPVPSPEGAAEIDGMNVVEIDGSENLDACEAVGGRNDDTPIEGVGTDVDEGRPKHAGSDVEPEFRAGDLDGPDQQGEVREHVPADAPDGDVDRLIGTASDRMAEAEASRRLSAHRRLRHAARTAPADRPRDGDGEAGRGAYGTDLAHAMNLDEAPGDTGAEASAPLVLVSSQRIDPDRIDAGEVGHRPQLGVIEASAARHAPRVDLSMLWAERGATELADRMVVAAGAISDATPEAEGFTRPDLMAALRQADPEGWSRREERLRTFSGLLSEGRIRKIGRGVYALAASADGERT